MAVVLDVDRLRRIFGDDLDGAADVVAGLAQDAAANRARIGAALDAGNLPAVSDAAHAVKGAAANVGADRLAALAAQIESAADAGDDATCAALLAAIDPAIDAVRAAAAGLPA